MASFERRVIYDISPLLHEDTAVWPGEERLQRRMLTSRRQGDALNTCALRAGSHLGAHADAPSLLQSDAGSAEQLPLLPYLGPCQLVRIRVAPNTAITPAHLAEVAIDESRLLIDTGTFNGDGPFRVDFASLTPESVEHLIARGVRTLGWDGPSVDAYASQDMRAHAVCFAKKLALLEGLVLWKVPVGRYELIALPLKLRGFDASPVRAVLRAV